MKTLTAAQIEDAAMKLLVDIQNLIREKPKAARFGLSSLARDLRRLGKAAELLVMLKWLASNGYLRKDVSAIYDMTDKGWEYAPPKPVKRERTPFFEGIADTIQHKPARSTAT